MKDITMTTKTLTKTFDHKIMISKILCSAIATLALVQCFILIATA